MVGIVLTYPLLILYFSDGTSWPCRKIRAKNDAGETISFGEWMVLVDEQNSQTTRTVQTTTWDAIRVCKNTIYASCISIHLLIFADSKSHLHYNAKVYMMKMARFT